MNEQFYTIGVKGIFHWSQFLSLSTDAIYQYSGGNFTVTGPKATAGIFATYPAPYLSLHAGFLDQVSGFTGVHLMNSCTTRSKHR